MKNSVYIILGILFIISIVGLMIFNDAKLNNNQDNFGNINVLANDSLDIDAIAKDGLNDCNLIGQQLQLYIGSKNYCYEADDCALAFGTECFYGLIGIDADTDYITKLKIDYNELNCTGGIAYECPGYQGNVIACENNKCIFKKFQEINSVDECTGLYKEDCIEYFQTAGNKSLEDLDCIKAGEIYQSPAIFGNIRGQCCDGLKIIAEYDMAPNEKNCNLFHEMTGGNLICSDCGNGICEEWENECNCPEDCKRLFNIEWSYCESDADCVLVQEADCCPCDDYAINLNFASEYYDFFENQMTVCQDFLCEPCALNVVYEPYCNTHGLCSKKVNCDESCLKMYDGRLSEEFLLEKGCSCN